MEQRMKIKDFIMLHMVFLVVALGGVASKMAASYEMLSIPFLFFYALYMLSLGVYALAWIQVLKRVPLVTAFCNKAVTIVWSMIFGKIFFGEIITVKSVLSTVLVIIGVLMVVTSDE